MDNIEQPPAKPARRRRITVSGVTAVVIVFLYLNISWSVPPLFNLQRTAKTMGGWFLLWVAVVACVLLFVFVGVRTLRGKRRDRLVWRVVKYSIISVGLAGFIVAALRMYMWSLMPPMSCSKAVIEVCVGVGPPDVNVYEGMKQAVTVTDPKELQRLVSFFPHLGQGWKWGLIGKWPYSKITFTASDGTVFTAGGLAEE